MIIVRFEFQSQYQSRIHLLVFSKTELFRMLKQLIFIFYTLN